MNKFHSFLLISTFFVSLMMASFSVYANVVVPEESVASTQSTPSLDINMSDVKSLMKVTGLGRQKAKAIVEYREKNGPFQSMADLQNVRGISPKLLAQIKKLFHVTPISPR